MTKSEARRMYYSSNTLSNEEAVNELIQMYIMSKNAKKHNDAISTAIRALNAKKDITEGINKALNILDVINQYNPLGYDAYTELTNAIVNIGE